MKLSKILLEVSSKEKASKKAEDFVVVYAGRFQPWTPGHYSSYKFLVGKFGSSKVYIGTSNKTDQEKSPFSFKEKKQIISTMSGVPANKIVQVTNPYKAEEITKDLDPNKVAFITAVSEKDGERLKGGKYFEKFTSVKNMEPMADKGYYVVTPTTTFGKMKSATEVRRVLGGESSEENKKKFFKELYGKDNDTIFRLITKKLTKKR